MRRVVIQCLICTAALAGLPAMAQDAVPKLIRIVVPNSLFSPWTRDAALTPRG